MANKPATTNKTGATPTAPAVNEANAQAQTPQAETPASQAEQAEQAANVQDLNEQQAGTPPASIEPDEAKIARLTSEAASLIQQAAALFAPTTDADGKVVLPDMLKAMAEATPLQMQAFKLNKQVEVIRGQQAKAEAEAKIAEAKAKAEAEANDLLNAFLDARTANENAQADLKAGKITMDEANVVYEAEKAARLAVIDRIKGATVVKKELHVKQGTTGATLEKEGINVKTTGTQAEIKALFDKYHAEGLDRATISKTIQAQGYSRGTTDAAILMRQKELGLK